MSNTCQTKTTSAFLSTIFISGVTATPDDLNIIAIEKVNLDNIGIADFGCPFSSRHISGGARGHPNGGTTFPDGGPGIMTDLELPYNSYPYECMPLMSCKPIYSVYITI